MWTWLEIRRDWLSGGSLGVPATEVVRAFNEVERAYGRQFIEHSRVRDGVQYSGSAPTLNIVSLGQSLSGLRGVEGRDALITKLKTGEQGSLAEAKAIQILREANPVASVQVEPWVRVGTRQRRPDFRIRQRQEPWVYCEVTQAETSEAYQQVQATAQELTTLGETVSGSYAVEVYLRREPSKKDLQLLRADLPELFLHEGPAKLELPAGLGFIAVGVDRPLQMVIRDHEGESYRPGLGVAWGRRDEVGGTRHVVVRMPFSDDRAEEFLTAEAKQLPRNAGTLIFMDTGGAPSSFKTWEPLLERRLQPRQHTRVSAICLMQSGHESTPAGEAVVTRTRLVVNPHAGVRLPLWIHAAVRRLEQSEDRMGLVLPAPRRDGLRAVEASAGLRC